MLSRTQSLEKPEAPQVRFCPAGAFENSLKGLPCEGVAASVVVDHCHPSIGMGIYVAARSGGAPQDETITFQG